MIKDHQIVRRDEGMILGIALENAVLDILTNDALLQQCLKLLKEPHRGLASTTIGSFGIYSVTLNLHHDETLSIFVDGPDFDQSRNLSAGIWLEKEDLRQQLTKAVQGAACSQ
jgi:hypothetical protein